MNEALEWIQANWQALVVAVGGVLAVALGTFLVPRLRHSRVSRVGRAVTTPLVLAWEAQGLHQVATSTGATGAAAWMFAGVTSGILLTLAAYADDHFQATLRQTGEGNLGIAGRLVWIVAVPMGLIVATTGHNFTEVALRLVLPVLASIVWWVKYAPLRLAWSADEQPSGPSSWRWRLQQFGVRLVHDERLIRRLVSLERKKSRGPRWLRARCETRLERATEVAQEHHVVEAHRRVHRTRTVVARLAQPFVEPDEEVRSDRQIGDHGEAEGAGRQRRQQSVDFQEEQDRAAAEAFYIETILAGQTISEEALGARYGRKRAWGRARVVASRTQLADSVIAAADKLLPQPA